MANKSWIGAGFVGLATAAGASYFSIANGQNAATTEAWAQVVSPAGTYSKLSLYVSANTGTTATAKFRKNSADGSQNVAIGSGATGWFEDTTNTDAVANGDSVCFLFTAAATGITLDGSWTVMFEPTSGGAVAFLGQGAALAGNAFATNPLYVVPFGSVQLRPNPGTSPGQSKMTWRAPGTFSRASIIGTITATYIKLNKNGSASSVSATIASSGVRVTDVTNTEAVVSGDEIEFELYGNSSVRAYQWYYRFVSADAKFETIGGNTTGFSTTGAGVFYTPIGRSNTTLTEASNQAKIPAAMTASKFRVCLMVNGANNGTRTWTLRKNGSDTTVSIATSSLSTGQFEDTTNSEAFAAGDLVSIKHVETQSSGSTAAFFNILWEEGTGGAAASARRTVWSEAA